MPNLCTDCDRPDCPTLQQTLQCTKHCIPPDENRSTVHTLDCLYAAAYADCRAHTLNRQQWKVRALKAEAELVVSQDKAAKKLHLFKLRVCDYLDDNFRNNPDTSALQKALQDIFG